MAVTRPVRLGVAAAATAIATLACTWVAACSHRSPYLRPGIAPPGGPGDRQVSFRVLLIGDAGEPTPQEPVLRALRRWARKDPEVTLVVFLGDNAYPEGLTPARQHEAEGRILQQLAVVRDSAAQALFIPGNHDWARESAGGHAAVLRQEAFVLARASFLPQGGCPGPEYLDLPATRPVVRVIAIDTQWWLQSEGRPTTACRDGSPEAVVAAIARALVTDLPVIVAAHHPLATHGPHGGFFDWRDHLFPTTRLARWLWIPLPGVGSLYPLFRQRVVQSEQDLVGTLNRRMRALLEDALSSRPPARGPLLIYASGHDHSLQILEGSAADYLVVSGAGSSRKLTPVGHGDRSLFAHEHAGFVAVEFAGKGIWLSVVEPVGDDEVVFRIAAVARQSDPR